MGTAVVLSVYEAVAYSVSPPSLPVSQYCPRLLRVRFIQATFLLSMSATRMASSFPASDVRTWSIERMVVPSVPAWSGGWTEYVFNRYRAFSGVDWSRLL